MFLTDAEVASTTITPLTYQWDTGKSAVGSYAIKATAIDDEGASMSDEISITIEPIFLATPLEFGK